MKNSHLLIPIMGQNTPRIRTKYKKWKENTQEKKRKPAPDFSNEAQIPPASGRLEPSPV
jgi:hypothetical protein